MRNTLIILLALVAGTAFAQAPVIDSMLIDESKGILSVYGDFGAAQGKVSCDSVELPILTWSASLITATIPDTGKGSAGGVVVEASSYISKERKISKWVYYTLSEVHSGSGHWLRDEYIKYTLGFRYDIESIILAHGFNREISFISMKHGIFDYKYYDTGVEPDTGKYDSDFQFSGEFDLRYFKVRFNNLCSSKIFHPDTQSQMCIAFLDSNLHIPSGKVAVYPQQLMEFKCDYSGSAFALPDSALLATALKDVKQEQAKSLSLACYPNPATSELTIVTTEPTRLLLYDVTGKIVKSEQATSNQTKWDVSLLPNGTYILGTSSGEMNVVQIVK